MNYFERAGIAELAKAGITVNGDKSYDIQVKNPRMYSRALMNGSLGFGDSYMDGDWEVEDMAEMITRLIKSGAEKNQAANFSKKLLKFSQWFFNHQDIERAKRVAEEHYDLGNDLYAAMLDKRLVYTCGYWKNATTLDEAQENKLRLICDKIGLKPGMRVLDVGCGWGSFAKFAAENYGVSVVGITISKEQVALAEDLCKGLSIEIKLLDYRLVKQEIPEPFDRIVSIGMFEHVGPKNFNIYFKTLSEVLKPDGLFLLHTIGGNGSDPWLEKHIFPGGYLPRIDQITTATDGKFVIEDLHNFGPDYDRTLVAWYENFVAAWPQLKATGKYDDRFYRMWRFYLLVCAATFRARSTQLWQFVLSPNGVPGGYTSIR